MREILFRGKRMDNGEWVEGCFVEKKDPLLESDVRNSFILAQGRGKSFVTWFPVDPATVGQFTGLLDKNGKRIFEQDVIKSHDGIRFEVKFGQHIDAENFAESYGWFAFAYDGDISLGEDWSGHEVIGNRFDNPEPLEVAPDE